MSIAKGLFARSSFLSFLFLVAIFSSPRGFSAKSPSAELFETYNVWKKPRFFVFGQLSKDLKTFEVWSAGKKSESVAVTKLPKCPAVLVNPGKHFEASRKGSGELMWGSRGSLAIEVSPNAPSEVVTLKGYNDISDCALRFQIDFNWTLSGKGTEARIIFSEIGHLVADRQIFIEENIFVAGLRYKVEAVSGLKFVRFGGASYFSPIINASLRASLPRLWNGFGEFRLGQSLKSFPKEVSFSRWEGRMGVEYLLNYEDGLTLGPFIGMERDFILTEQSLSVPTGAENILAIGLGSEVSLEFLDVWVLKGALFTSLFSSSAVEGVKWNYYLMEGSIGYRLSALLRLSGVGNFRLVHNQDFGSMWSGEMGAKIEMVF